LSEESAADRLFSPHSKGRNQLLHGFFETTLSTLPVRRLGEQWERIKDL
jgi:hypothetical protein